MADESKRLTVSVTLRGEKRTIILNTDDLKNICDRHLVAVAHEGARDNPQPAFAVSGEGLTALRQMVTVATTTTRAADHNQDDLDVCLLRIAMTPHPRIDDTLRRQLFFGLLWQRPGGLTVLKEDRTIIAPIPEISIPPTMCEGSVSFLPRFGRGIPTEAPDLSSLCEVKRLFGIPVHVIIGFI